MLTAPWATFMEKAMQVGLPHSLQFFFGVSLKISRPFSAMVLPPYSRAEIISETVFTDSGWRRMTASLPLARQAAAVMISI